MPYRRGASILSSRTQFTFYESFYKATQRIKDPLSRAQVYDSICEYALYGVVPNMESLSDVAAIAFELVRPNLDASRKKAEAGRAGGSRKHNGSKSKQTEATQEQGETRSKKENEIENKKENEIEKKSYNGRDRPPARFVPPTVDEVKSYCQERKNSVDPQHFVDYYTANGWVQGRGGKPIRDWKAAVRTWERSGVQSISTAPKSVSPGQNFNPSPDRVQRQSDWLDKFLEEQEGKA